MARSIVASVVNARVARALTDKQLATRLRHIADKQSKAYDAGERRAYLEEAARRLASNCECVGFCNCTTAN